MDRDKKQCLCSCGWFIMRFTCSGQYVYSKYYYCFHLTWRNLEPGSLNHLNKKKDLNTERKRRGSRQRCLEGGLLDVWTSCPFTPRSPNKGQGPPCSHVLGPSFRWARMQGQPCLTPQPHTPSTGSSRMHVSDVSSVMTVSLAIACDLEIYSFPTPGHMLRKHTSIVCVNGQNYRWKCPIALANRGPQKMHTEAHDCHGRRKGIECESSNFVFFPLLLLDLWR